MADHDPTTPEPATRDRYGRFSEDGTVYRVTDPATPRPWANIIANPRIGVAVSHTGCGFTWIDNSQLAVLTAWSQDLALESSGKFLYLRDADSGALWSPSPAPVWAALEAWECRHGLGWTEFEARRDGITSRWTLFCHPDEPAELWIVALENHSDVARRVEATAYLEWCMGVAPAPRREFHKLFVETEWDREREVVLAGNRMWDVPSERWGHWNTDFPYVAALACSSPIRDALGDKSEFLGPYGSPRAPRALRESRWSPSFGRHHDPVAAIRTTVDLAPRGRRDLTFVLAAGRDRDDAATLATSLRAPAVAAHALGAVRARWSDLLGRHRVETPRPDLDRLVNDWARYQAISARLWGRCGYYQQSGAYGFRDQLQDSHVWLTIDPDRCREQIRLHAGHQFSDGSVVHWWHPLTEQGHVTRMTDDLLWLAFVTASYLKETGDFGILDDPAPFLDAPEDAPLREHVRRAFERVFSRTSPRGIPYIGAGDWNDGLSAVGLGERGESFWLAEFLAGLLADWAVIERSAGDSARAETYAGRRAALVDAINRHGWDGEWYLRATLDDGSPLGSRRNRRGRIFLNSQVWAVLADVAPPERAAACMAAVRGHLVDPAGALLLAPAFDRPLREVGYITRYAPGLRENGGVYTHAATWAIAAACKIGDADLVDRLLLAIDPSLKDPDRYWAEPYVLPGNVDGPDSPHHGRAGWTWYTGSAAWLHRVVAERVLGVRPDWDGLHFDPCLPPGWDRARVRRPWRGTTLDVAIERDPALPAGCRAEVAVRGAELPAAVLPPRPSPGETLEVRVRIAAPRLVPS